SFLLVFVAGLLGAVRLQLSASSTCGLDGPQNYCIIGYLEEEQKCFSCDSRLPFDPQSNPSSHRIENVITTFEPERKMKWWQSVNGDIHEVSIQLDLETIFQFSHLVLTFKSFRPTAMLVERSQDFGRSWKVFRYFSEDCSLYFPHVPKETADSIDDVVCDSRYSGSEPSTDGEVVLKALDPIFDIEDPYAPHIQALITMTNLRVNFTRLFTLGDTLLGRKRRNPQNKYYYALYEMVVRGSCFCNGHAAQCTPVGGRGDVFTEEGMVHGRCVCQHNTAGYNCELCQDFHHDSPWRPGGEDNAAVWCNCNGHSDSCHFDVARFEASGGVSGGVCENCRNDREGDQCERCRPFTFQDPQRAPDDPNACIPCDCSPLGSESGGLCDVVTGQCLCKANAEGQRCDRCKPGHFGLRQEDPLGCQPCGCHPLGSAGPCDAQTGSCQCEPQVLGRSCDRCVVKNKPSQRSNIQIAISILMCPQYGAIPLEPGFPLQIIPRERNVGLPITWTGLGLVRVLTGAGLRFTVENLPLSMDYQLVIRYEPEVNKPFSGRKAKFTFILLDSPVCLNSGGRYFIDVTFNKRPESDPNASSHILIDSLGLIPSIESVQDLCSQTDLDSFRRLRCIGLAAEAGPHDAAPEVCEGLVKSMSARIHKGAIACACDAVGSLSPYCSKLGGVCECKPNVIGRCCDSCAPQTYGFGPEGCKPCDCDPRGSESDLCDQVRGQCACRREMSGRRCDRCQGHSTGPNCERCVEGFYGSPVSRVPCEPCLCPDLLQSGRFFASSCQRDPETQSLSCLCREGHSGPQCEWCSPGYYADLLLSGARCEKCDCNDNIDPDDGEACDRVTGECLRCLHNTGGRHCEDCRRGYYGRAEDQDCKECSCDRRGTEVTLCPLQSPCFCDARTGQCPCRPGVRGVLCDECEDGYWNMEQGCMRCSCDLANSHSNNCDKETGQCPCLPEYGGRKCDECGENHFGNPDLQCVSCDCNLDGTLRPSCHSETGECNCRPGVTGIFCDECAPGFNDEFPACQECHPCAKYWRLHVSDVERATQTMGTLMPRPSSQPRHQLMLRSLFLELDQIKKNMTEPATTGTQTTGENIVKYYHG
uniref:Laminin subunit beta 4 n=1 Tax=Neogobius melanostomus TaxID=47308 RepID=A0A8C6S5C5_9GOBI